MAIELHVTLDTTKTPPLLDVDQENNSNHVGQSPNAQTIIWKLVGNAALGTFNSPTDPNNPGFTWAGNGPNQNQTIFGPAQLADNSRELTMTDLNNSQSTTGTWIYQLQAHINGTNYYSEMTSITGTTTDPCIKNN